MPEAIEAQSQFLNFLNKNQGYRETDIEPSEDVLYVKFHDKFYIPNFQFDEHNLCSDVKRDISYLLEILKEKNISNVRRVNFFLVPRAPYDVSVNDLIDMSFNAKELIYLAKNYGTNNLTWLE